MGAALVSDSAALARALAPTLQQEARWRRTDWIDSSPHHSRFVAANGQRLQVLDWGGSGRALVFLPGLGHTAHIFDAMAPRFTDRFRVLGVTLRGHGASSAPPHAYTVDSLAADVGEVVAALHIAQVILVGHSLGGHVANRVAALYPGLIARVIYLDATKDSTGLAAVRAAAPTTRPAIEELPPSPLPRAHDAQRRLYFAFWSDAQEADVRAARTAPQVFEMVDLYAPADWRSVRQRQLAICALDTPVVQFPWLQPAQRVTLGSAIAHYVDDLFVPWERAGCERFAREAPNGSLDIIYKSNHYVFLVSPEQTYRAMRKWLSETR